MNIAKLMDKKLTEFRGNAGLFKCEPPLEGHEYVIASACHTIDHGIETYVFPSNENGDVEDWGELDCSIIGTLQFEDVFEKAGYTIIKE